MSNKPKKLSETELKVIASDLREEFPLLPYSHSRLATAVNDLLNHISATEGIKL